VRARDVAGIYRIEGILAGMPKRGMANVMPEGHGLDQVLIETEGLGAGAGDLCHLQGMREARAKVILRGGNEDLGFLRKAAESYA